MRFFRRDDDKQACDAPPPDNGGGREFFAFKAARWIGGAAKKAAGAAGDKLSHAFAGQSAENLRAEVEKKAGDPGQVDSAVGEWATLLATSDGTPRYESPEGPLTFRAAFLQSRAFEIALDRVALREQAPPASWSGFLRSALVEGGETHGASLTDVLCASRRFPDCRRWIEEVVAVIKADWRHEHLRCARTVLGVRAEELRASLRTGSSAPSEGRSQSKVPASEARAVSLQAVHLYSKVRVNLGDAISNLWSSAQERRSKLHNAHARLHELGVEAGQRLAVASGQRDEYQKQMHAATASTEQVVGEVENDTRRVDVDAGITALEARQRELRAQLEAVSQELAAKRDARMGILGQREAQVKQLRRCTEETEQRFEDLRPARFHKVLSSRADQMTEGEIVRSLKRCSEHLRSFGMTALTQSQKMKESDDQSASSTGLDTPAKMALARKHMRSIPAEAVASRIATIVEMRREALLAHAQHEHSRLQAIEQEVGRAVHVLILRARERAAREAMGLNDWRHLSRDPGEILHLRSGLAMGEECWEEILQFWGESGIHLDEKESSDALGLLEATRDGVVRRLSELQAVDPTLHMEVIDPTEASTAVPHGWSVHHDPSDGRPYYYNAVSGKTQWDRPMEDAAVSVGWRLLATEEGARFYHNPYDGNSMWWPDLPAYPAVPATAAQLGPPIQ